MPRLPLLPAPLQPRCHATNPHSEVTAAQHEAEYAARVEARRAAGLTVPVDLECEYDR